MSKAILELDMPDRCGHCRLAVMQRCYPICAVTGLQCTESKPGWCPLRELPEWRFEEDFDWTDLTQKENAAMNHGWNKCLKRLEAEHEQPETVG